MTPERPIWFADSSGLVVGNEYFDITSRQTEKLKSPPFPRGEDVYRVARHVHPGTKAVIHAGIKWDQEKKENALVTVFLASGVNSPPGKPMQFQVTFPRAPLPMICDDFEIHPSPDRVEVVSSSHQCHGAER